jgi:phosphate transport system substrate-binding protein
MKKILSAIAALVIIGSTALNAAEDTLILDGSTTVGPIAKAFAEYYMSVYPEVNITISESGSGNGAKSLMNGTCDIGNLSRFMKDKEFAAAAAKGIMPVAHVVAMDGLAVVINPANSVKEITIEKLRDIYMGKIKNWKELGGPDKEIVVVSRDTNSGTYETFYKLVMTHKVDGEKIKEKIKSGSEYVGSNGAVRQRVAATPASIGYIGLGFLDRSVKALPVDGIMPDKATVAAGTYPIARPLYMFTNGYPKLGSHAFRFVTIYLTEKGQEMVEDIGYIPMTNY